MAGVSDSEPRSDSQRSARPRWRGSAFRWFALVFSTVASFLVAEIVYRQAVSNQHQFSVSPTGSQYRFYRFDPILGWANAPGATGRYERGEFSYDVSINEHGMRQRAVSLQPQPGRPRIAVLGDSFLWGIGVSDEDRVTELLAADLGGIDVLNFGVSGYSPVQYLLMVDRVADFSPSLVILFFCLGNDFGDNVLRVRYGYYRPYAAVNDQNKIEIRGYPIPAVGDFGFSAHSRLLGSAILGRLRQSMVPRRTVQAGLLEFEDDLIYSGRRSSPRLQNIRSQAIEINQALLAEVRDGFAAQGIDVMVVSVPTKLDMESENFLDGSGSVAEHELGETCRKLGISFFPAVDLFNPEHFWTQDAHWNPSGHRLMATALAENLASHPILAAYHKESKVSSLPIDTSNHNAAMP